MSSLTSSRTCPAETATFLAARVPVLPDPNVLATTQDRLAEKNFVAALGIATAPYAAVAAPAALAAALERIGRPAVLKTRRFGYDGKGQTTIRNGSEPEAAWREVGGQPCILEAFVPFAREVSVVAARAPDGAVECFDVTENEHRDHILKVSRVPAALSDDAARGGASDRRDHRAEIRLCRRAGRRDVRAARRRICSSTRSRRGCTIPAIGRSTAPRCRNSSSTSGRSPAGRWQSLSAAAAWK